MSLLFARNAFAWQTNGFMNALPNSCRVTSREVGKKGLGTAGERIRGLACLCRLLGEEKMSRH